MSVDSRMLKLPALQTLQAWLFEFDTLSREIERLEDNVEERIEDLKGRLQYVHDRTLDAYNDDRLKHTCRMCGHDASAHLDGVSYCIADTVYSSTWKGEPVVSSRKCECGGFKPLG